MKNLITICLFLLAVNLHSQILNPSFEEWDSVRIGSFNWEFPKHWNHSFIAVFKDTIATQGNFSTSFSGGYGPADGLRIGSLQQKFLVPSGLDSISFYLKTSSFRPFQASQDFYGYGLLRDTISHRSYYLNDSIIGKSSHDTLPDFKRHSFLVPVSLWGKEMYLSFYVFPIDWGTTPYLIIDDIQLHGDFSVSTQHIDNQQISIFPNPAEDWLFIKNEGLKFSKIEVFSIEGKLMFSEKGNDKINISQLPSGSYFLVLKGAKNEVLASQRFLKK